MTTGRLVKAELGDSHTHDGSMGRTVYGHLHEWLIFYGKLGDGFKDFLFSSLFGEDSHFD